MAADTKGCTGSYISADQWIWSIILSESESGRMVKNALIIAQYFPPDVNGSSTRAYNAARGLQLQGYNVTVVAAFPHYPNGREVRKEKGRIFYSEEIDGIKVLRTWLPDLPHWPNIKRIVLHGAFMCSSLIGFCYIRGVDIIFAMNPNPISFFPALAYKVFYRKKIIRNVDDLWPEVFYELGIVRSRLFKTILDSLTKISYRIPSAIIPVSEGYVNTLLTKYRVPRDKIFVIEQGVDIKKFPPVSHQELFQKKSRRKIVMYSGALNIGYNFDVLINAAKLLVTEPIYFIIRGRGELSEKLKKTIESAASKNIEIRTDLFSQEELVCFLSKADIFLLPMSSVGVIDQGLPTKIMEYQALGKPIICISSGEAARYITRTQSGLVTDSNQPSDLARLIMQLAKDEKLARELGKNGFNNVSSNLTLEMVGKRLIEVIERIK